MRLAIRDDDTSYFTRPSELEDIYAPLGTSVPVSLAVTPFAVESFFLGDPERFHQSDLPRPLGGNPELTAYLREGIGAGRWSVMCHGYTHAYARSASGDLIPECVWKSGERVGREAALGKRYLEETLNCTVRAFVPPGNAMRLPAMRAASRTFPRLLTTVPARRWREFARFPLAAGVLARRLAHQIRHGGPNPHPERLGAAWLLPSLSLTAVSQWAGLVERFDVCRRLGADLALAVHYWELRGEVRGLFYRFLEHAAARGAVFVHCDDLFPGAAASQAAAATRRAPSWRPAFPPAGLEKPHP